MIKHFATPGREETIELLNTLFKDEKKSLEWIDKHGFAFSNSLMLYESLTNEKLAFSPKWQLFYFIEQLTQLSNRYCSYSVFIPSYGENYLHELCETYNEEEMVFACIPNKFFVNQEESYRKCQKFILDKHVAYIIMLPRYLYSDAREDYSLLVLNVNKEDTQTAVIDGRDFNEDKEFGLIDLYKLIYENKNSITISKTCLYDAIRCIYKNESAYSISDYKQLSGIEILTYKESHHVNEYDISQKQITAGDLYSSAKDAIFHNEYFHSIQSYNCIRTDSQEYSGMMILVWKGNYLYYTSNNKVYVVERDCDVLTLKQTDIVLPEYIVYSLCLREFWDESEIMDADFFIPPIEIQKQIIEELRLEYEREHAEEIKAERERQSLQTASSDLGHILASSFSKINAALWNLNDSDKLQAEDKESVLFVQDNIDYMQRMINLWGRDSLGNVKLSHIPLCSMLREYVEKYSRFGANTFSIDMFFDKVGDDVTISGNSDLLYILLDSLLDNASRHGFGKRWSKDNIVAISVTPVIYEGNNYLNLCIANNGSPMELTQEQYVSKGIYGMKGHTGLGGNHVYEAVKRMGGYFHIRQDEGWLKFNCLLPLTSEVDIDNLTPYEYECL